MSWNIKTPGDYINGPLTVAGDALFSSKLGVGAAATVAKLQTNGALCVSGPIGNLSSNPQANTFSADILSNQVRLMALGPNNSTAGAFTFVLASANASVYSTPMTLDSVGLGVGGLAASKVYAQKDGTGGANSNTIGSAFGASHAQASVGGSDLAFAIRCTGSTLAGIGGQNYTTQVIANSINANAFEVYTIGAIPLILGTNGVERARFNSTGAFVLAGGTQNGNGIGIAFPGTQSASTDANTLDDYEEGTFTPTVTSVGGTGIVYTPDASDSGRYTKIGRVVTFQVRLVGTYTGTFNYIRVALPFIATNSNPDSAVTGYNNSTGTVLSGRTDYGSAFFVVPFPQPSGATALYSGFITS